MGNNHHVRVYWRKGYEAIYWLGFVKLEKNLIFLKNGKISKIAEMVQGSLEIFLDLG